MRYEILDGPDGNVINTIVASPEFVEANYEHYRLVQETPVTPTRDELRLSQLTFNRRFDSAERIALRNYADRQHADYDPIIEDGFALVNAADYIVPTDTDTINLMGYMLQQGYITESRHSYVLHPFHHEGEIGYDASIDGGENTWVDPSA